VDRTAARVHAAAARVRRLLTKVYDDHSWQPRDWHGRFAEMAEPGPAVPGIAALDEIAPPIDPSTGDLIQVSGPFDLGIVSLREEEGYKGGHTISKHVGKSDEELIYRAAMRALNEGGRFPNGPISASTFDTVSDANYLVNSTIMRNIPAVLAVQTGVSPAAVIESDFTRRTGREIYFSDATTPWKVRTPTSVRVILIHDDEKPKQFRVHSAYPFER
jgi:hypothetical protein